MAASKNWQRGKISTWPEQRGVRELWPKYKAVVLSVSGVGVLRGVCCGMLGYFLIDLYMTLRPFKKFSLAGAHNTLTSEP